MLGRDRDFLGAECLCYAGYGFPGKDALEDTAHNGSGFFINHPFAFLLFGSAVAIADTARTAQALFHSGLENSLDFAAGVGNVPLVYHVTEDRHNIKAVGGVKVVICGDKTHMVLVKGALQKPHFNHVTPDSALVFDDNRCHVPRPDFVQHSVKPRTLERSSPDSVIGEMPDIGKSVDIFGSQPERLGSIIMTAVTALALLISKVLDKARELSAKLFEKETIQPVAEPNERRTTQVIPQTDKIPMQEKITHKEPTANPSSQKQELQAKTQTTEQEKPKIPPKPVMSAEATAYPKLLKIYKELNRQNGIIFDAERERNELELERDSLKGFAKLTKKGELQSRIERKNEEIDLLKIGLSGIVKRYGFQTVHDFYKVFSVSKTANAEYRDKVDKWEEQYGEKVQKKEESISKRLRNYQRENADRQTKQISKSRNRGAR